MVAAMMHGSSRQRLPDGRGAGRTLFGLLAFAAGAYATAIRPRLLRWGATDDEVRRPYPGADLIPDGTRSATMAVTLDAPPARVWPWLAQMGYDRAGWYSWDHLDNMGHPSAERIHAEWQEIHAGTYTDRMQSWQIASLEPGRYLGLRASRDLRTGRVFDPAGPRPRYFTDSTWGFLLEGLPEERTRLIVSGYWSMRPRWLQPILSTIFLEPAHWIMQTRQFANLQRRVRAESEREADAAAGEARGEAIAMSA